MGNKVGNFLIERDIYGAPITVNYKGSDVYKTKLGAFFSLVTYVLILVNLGMAVQSYFNGSKQYENQQIRLYDRFHAGDFPLLENKFTLAMPLIKFAKEIGRHRLSRHTRRQNILIDENTNLPWF